MMSQSAATVTSSKKSFHLTNHLHVKPLHLLVFGRHAMQQLERARYSKLPRINLISQCFPRDQHRFRQIHIGKSRSEHDSCESFFSWPDFAAGLSCALQIAIVYTPD
jgi:hypothetical protein